MMITRFGDPDGYCCRPKIIIAAVDFPCGTDCDADLSLNQSEGAGLGVQPRSKGEARKVQSSACGCAACI
jgi:hypothetical protein